LRSRPLSDVLKGDRILLALLRIPSANNFVGFIVFLIAHVFDVADYLGDDEGAVFYLIVFGDGSALRLDECFSLFERPSSLFLPFPFVVQLEFADSVGDVPYFLHHFRHVFLSLLLLYPLFVLK
jgi:hypothetical protein